MHAEDPVSLSLSCPACSTRYSTVIAHQRSDWHVTSALPQTQIPRCVQFLCPPSWTSRLYTHVCCSLSTRSGLKNALMISIWSPCKAGGSTVLFSNPPAKTALRSHPCCFDCRHYHPRSLTHLDLWSCMPRAAQPCSKASSRREETDHAAC